MFQNLYIRYEQFWISNINFVIADLKVISFFLINHFQFSFKLHFFAMSYGASTFSLSLSHFDEPYSAVSVAPMWFLCVFTKFELDNSNFPRITQLKRPFSKVQKPRLHWRFEETLMIVTTFVHSINCRQESLHSDRIEVKCGVYQSRGQLNLSLPLQISQNWHYSVPFNDQY